MKIAKETRDHLVQSGKFDYFMKQRLDVHRDNPDLLFKTKIDVQAGNYNPEAFPELTKEETAQCSHLYANRKRRRSTLAERLYFWVVQRKGVEVYFFTFTFSNETLKKTTEEDRKDRLRRLLRSVCKDYVLNIDHGNATEREHYHGFMVLESGKYPRKPKRVTLSNGKTRLVWSTEALNGYKMGNYTLEEVKSKNKDIKKVAGYIDKVTNHALKTTAGNVSYMSGTEYHEYQKLRNSLSPDMYQWDCLAGKVAEIEEKIVQLTHNEEAPIYLYRANWALKDRPPLTIR